MDDNILEHHLQSFKTLPNIVIFKNIFLFILTVGMVCYAIIFFMQEIHSFLSNRQSEKQSGNVPNERSAAFSNADELTKYKKLLDDGAITKEEYDAKKKQLLAL